jgi:hypothetical protein
MMTPKREARFWAKAEERGGCLVWTGYTTPKGYGKVGVNGVVMRAHRVAYELTNGPIPAGMQIDHTCHVRACIKPEHLRPVTQKQNQENRAGAIRNNKSGVRGVASHSGRWGAHVGHNGIQLYLGMFATVEEAEAVVVAKRLELFTHNDADRSRPDKAAFSCPDSGRMTAPTTNHHAPDQSGAHDFKEQG